MLVAGKVIIYMDIYGQLSEEGKVYNADSSLNCTSFLGHSIINATVIKDAMQFVILGLSHWVDMQNNFERYN